MELDRHLWARPPPRPPPWPFTPLPAALLPLSVPVRPGGAKDTLGFPTGMAWLLTQGRMSGSQWSWMHTEPEAPKAGTGGAGGQSPCLHVRLAQGQSSRQSHNCGPPAPPCPTLALLVSFCPAVIGPQPQDPSPPHLTQPGSAHAGTSGLLSYIPALPAVGHRLGLLMVRRAVGTPSPQRRAASSLRFLWSLKPDCLRFLQLCLPPHVPDLSQRPPPHPRACRALVQDCTWLWLLVCDEQRGDSGFAPSPARLQVRVSRGGMGEQEKPGWGHT